MSSEPDHSIAPELEASFTSKILIVEDSVADATLFTETVGALEGANIAVTHCLDYDSGLAAVREGHHQIAFIDFRLGQQDGPALIAAAGGRLCPTPMVLLTGRSGVEAEREAMEAGAIDFVDKALLSPQLLGRVIRYARHNHSTARQFALSQDHYRQLAESAVQANMQKSRFFAEMSHELRTPLNAIIGFSEIIKDQVVGELEGPSLNRYLEYTEDIHACSRHLLSLINDLLDLSKFEAGAFEPKMLPVHVADLVDDLLKIMSAQIEAAGIALTVEIAEELPDSVVDRRLILQALLNVLSNAVKFTGTGGEIKVVAKLSNDRLVLAISDTGCGIAAHELDAVLLPYRQGSAMETRPGGGTGLGLALTSSILELHHGYVSIDSTAGIGTTVELYLPINLQ